MLSTRNASKFKISFIIGAVLIIVTISCSPKPSPSDSPTQTFTNYPSITSTPKPSITSTSTFNSTPTQTLAVKPNPTIVIDPTAFLTPFPTVPFDEAAYNFEILLHTNGGCQLPCFWGMTPGQTTEAELIQFGNQFSYNSDFFYL